MFASKFEDDESVCCGLVKLVEFEKGWVTKPAKVPIPLVSVNVNASVVHAVAQVEVTQCYVNKEEQPIEAVYYFPVNPDGAVTRFQAELEGKVIKGVVKEKEEARKDYDQAVKNQKSAFLGEETKPDIFKVRVGFLKPGSQVKVIIGYTTEVKNDPGSNSIRFYIPTTIAPRYVSASETDGKAKAIKAMKFSEDSPAPLSLKVAVSLQDGIKLVESPTHMIKVNKAAPIPGNEQWYKCIVELEGKTTDMDRDFVLHIQPKETYKPRIYSEKSKDGSTALMVHLVPSFKLDDQKTELIFVLDRSGSMDGQSIELAKKALLLFLHSMPTDCYFNVVGFGSIFEFLFPESVKYHDGTLQRAIAHAKELYADLGGTEILEPLKEIYSKPEKEGYLRQIFILTDGEVSNTDGVLGIIQANTHKARVFSLGIGDTASHHLVEGMAQAGGGTSAFVTYEESIDKKVLNQLKNGLQPSLTDIELEWEGLNTPLAAPGKIVEPVLNKEKTLLGYNKPIKSTSTSADIEIPKNKQSPKRIPPVYDGSQLLVFGLFKDDCPKSVVVKAQSPDGPLAITIQHSEANDVGQLNILHKLAAIKLVRELELEVAALHVQDFEGASKKEEKLKKEIVQISCENQITSKYTSYIAVDEKDDKPLTDGWVMETGNVPSQLSTKMWTPKRQNMMIGTYVPLCASRSDQSTSSGSDTSAVNILLSGGHTVSRSRSVKDSNTTNSNEIVPWPTSPGAAEVGFVEEGVQCLAPELDPPLLQLISLQSFDGSYNLNEKLAQVLEKPLDIIKDAALKNNVSEEVFATALAIAYYQDKLVSEKELWELVEIKARKWLVKTIGADKIDAILESARELIGG